MTWRVGRTLGRTLYCDDVLVGLVDTPEIATAIAQRMNLEPGERWRWRWRRRGRATEFTALLIVGVSFIAWAIAPIITELIAGFR